MANELFSDDEDEHVPDAACMAKHDCRFYDIHDNRKCNEHVDLADYYIHEQVERKRITVSYTNTKDMVADIFTKPLPRVSFSKLSGMFMAAEI